MWMAESHGVQNPRSELKWWVKSENNLGRMEKIFHIAITWLTISEISSLHRKYKNPVLKGDFCKIPIVSENCIFQNRPIPKTGPEQGLIQNRARPRTEPYPKQGQNRAWSKTGFDPKQGETQNRIRPRTGPDPKQAQALVLVRPPPDVLATAIVTSQTLRHFDFH